MSHISCRVTLLDFSDSFGSFPRSFPLALAIAMPSRVRILMRSASNSAKVATMLKVLVTSRMKRSGQSWGRDGGQGVLTFRSLLVSGRFDRAWAALAPSLSRSDGWKPPQCVNENGPVAQIALAA